MTNTTTLLVLLSALTTAACGAPPGTASDPMPANDTAAPLSCDVVITGDPKVQIWKFSDPDQPEITVGLGVECTALGGGYFECPTAACLGLAIAGTCPHCPGGGE